MKHIRVLQNVSWLDHKKPEPSIKLVEGDVGWADAYANWISGKNPTDSAEWKKGVFMHFEPVPENVEPPKPKAPSPLGYAVFGLKTLAAAVACGIGWAIWELIQLVRG